MSEAAITALLDPVAHRCALEVDSIELLRAGSRTLLRVFLDGDGASGRGPNMDEIAEASKAISVALDGSSVMGDGPYVLEVSSRGVTRPLTKPAHFRRNIGRLVAFALVGGEKFTGRVTETSDETVTVVVDDSPRIVALADVVNAVVQVELSRASADVFSEDEDEESESEEE